MEIESFYRTVLGKIDAEVKDIDGKLVAGTGIADWVAYKGLVERRRGVLAIRQEITDIWGKIFERQPIRPPGSQ